MREQMVEMVKEAEVLMKAAAEFDELIEQAIITDDDDKAFMNASTRVILAWILLRKSFLRVERHIDSVSTIGVMGMMVEGSEGAS
jgi:hypothetical protein